VAVLIIIGRIPRFRDDDELDEGEPFKELPGEEGNLHPRLPGLPLLFELIGEALLLARGKAIPTWPTSKQLMQISVSKKTRALYRQHSIRGQTESLDLDVRCFSACCMLRISQAFVPV
jgi:hypothetical protein